MEISNAKPGFFSCACTIIERVSDIASIPASNASTECLNSRSVELSSLMASWMGSTPREDPSTLSSLSKNDSLLCGTLPLSLNFVKSLCPLT